MATIHGDGALRKPLSWLEAGSRSPKGLKGNWAMTIPYLSKLSLGPDMGHLRNHPTGHDLSIRSPQGPAEWNVFLVSPSISQGLQGSICLANHPTPPPCQISCWGLHLRVKQLNRN